MSEKQLEKLYYSIYPMNQCETQSKSYEETKELCETLEKEMILRKIWPEPCMEYIVITPAQS